MDTTKEILKKTRSFALVSSVVMTALPQAIENIKHTKLQRVLGEMSGAETI